MIQIKKVGIDFSRTINEYPKTFSLLTQIFKKIGYEIYIIGGCSEVVEHKIELVKTFCKEHNILYDVIDIHHHDVHSHRDKYKGKYCKANNIDVMLDDDDKPKGYLEDIERHSPDTIRIVVK